MEESTDSELVLRAQQHDARAAAELYNRHNLAIYRYALRLLQRVENAEDAVQTTFLKFFTSLDQLHDPAAVKGWLYAIARHEVYSQFRRKRNDGSIDDVEIIDEATPHEQLVHKEEIELVQVMVTRLKTEHREVLHLLEYEHLSYEEIARVTGLSVSAVESRIFRARKELAKRITTHYKH
jgi:RNA polymerase sigma-70 factor (ECF subfamily)